MNLNNAPKFFWAALSISMLLLTAGALMIAYRATSVSVEFADAKVRFADDKIEVSRVISETKQQLEALQRQNQELEQAKAELERRIVRLSTPPTNLTNSGSSRAELVEFSAVLSNLSRTLPPQEKLGSDLRRLDMIQQSLNRTARK